MVALAEQLGQLPQLQRKQQTEEIESVFSLSLSLSLSVSVSSECNWDSIITVGLSVSLFTSIVEAMGDLKRLSS